MGELFRWHQSRFSKSTFERGKNICKLDDYFEYEIDGGYTFTSEEVYIFQNKSICQIFLTYYITEKITIMLNRMPLLKMMYLSN